MTPNALLLFDVLFEYLLMIYVYSTPIWAFCQCHTDNTATHLNITILIFEHMTKILQ